MGPKRERPAEWGTLSQQHRKIRGLLQHNGLRRERELYPVKIYLRRRDTGGNVYGKPVRQWRQEDCADWLQYGRQYKRLRCRLCIRPGQASSRLYKPGRGQKRSMGIQSRMEQRDTYRVYRYRYPGQSNITECLRSGLRGHHIVLLHWWLWRKRVHEWVRLPR